MIKIKKEGTTISVIHDSIKDAKNHFILEIFLISILGIVVFFMEKISLYKIITVCFIIIGILGIFDFLYALEKTEMHFEEKEIIIYRRKICKAKKKKILALKYTNIKKLESYTPISSKGGPYLRIITFSGEIHEVYPTISKKDVEEIINLYLKFKPKENRYKDKIE